MEESEEEVSQPFDHVLSREEKKKRFTSTGSKVVSMNGRGVEVYVIKPQDFAEAQTAADLLKKGRTVVINLEGVELTVAQRSIDFIGGATYARAFDNCISFGPNLPGQKDMCHQTDEFISIDNLILASKIYAKAIYELGTNY